MSDTDRLYRLLKREGSRGVHTHDLRREGISGNPSQRATDVEQKYGVKVARPREFRGGRNGSRFKLVGQGAGTPQGAPSSVLPGQSRVGGRGEPVLSERAANATSDPAARLFDLPSRSAFTDPEDVAA